ncbi:MAG: indole-3-glycerol phosphate synthase TrpC [Acidimicrobiales bacterium]
MATYLDRIAAWHREVASRDPRPLRDLAAEAEAALPPRDFVLALGARRDTDTRDTDGGRAIALVAEIKRRSPSKGDISPDLDPAEVATQYAAGGAACLSVLTDGPHFGGSREDLESARAAVGLPVLRKDFTVAPRDVYDARIMGADAVLLIVALLEPEELAECHRLAQDLAMAALVEVHDEDELERALGIGARLVGVNQRDLHSFEVDRERARRVANHIPPGVVKIAESGVESPQDVVALAQAGFDGVLVGEALLRSRDRQAAVAGLLGRAVPCG